MNSSEKPQPSPDATPSPEIRPSEPAVEEQNSPDDTMVRQDSIDRQNRSKEISSSLRVILEINDSDAFDDVGAVLQPWAEKFGKSREKMQDILASLDWAKEAIAGEFSPQEQTEIICRLTETVEKGHLSPDMLSDLIKTIRRPTEGEELDKEGVGFYHNGQQALILTEGFFEKNDDGGWRYDTAGMLNHEVGHGVADHGGLYDDESRSAMATAFREKSKESIENRPELLAVYEVIETAEQSYDFQTERIQKYLDRISELENQPVGQTPEEISKRKEELIQQKIFTANEIIADKVGLYLESNGTLEDFIQVSFGDLTRRSKEIVVAAENREAFKTSCKLFFDFVSRGMEDKVALAARIKESTEAGHADDEYDFFGAGSSEPGVGEKSSSDNSADSMWAETAALAEAFMSPVEESIPVTELKKAA